MNKLEFENYVIDKLREVLPSNANFNKEEDLVYSFKRSDGTSMKVFLFNAWDIYKKTNKLDYVDTIVKNTIDANVHHYDESQIFPVQRLWGTYKDYSDSIIVNQSVGDLAMVIVHDRERMIQTVSSEEIKEHNRTREDIIKIALDNLKKQKWVYPVEVAKKAEGKIMIFDETDKCYNHQFFVPDMVKKHIGDNFFFSIPTINNVIVFVPNFSCSTWRTGMLVLGEILLDMYFKDPKNLSKLMYKVRNGKYSVIGE